MKQVLALDPSLITADDKRWLELICTAADDVDVRVSLSRIPGRQNATHQNDLVAVVGVACGAASLAIAALRWIRESKQPPSARQLLDECEAFLALQGVVEYRLQYVSGFDDFCRKTGKPCLVRLIRPGAEPVTLRIGRTKETLIVTLADYDSRAFH